MHGSSCESAAQSGGQSALQRKTFHLLEVGRILDDAVANNSWKADADAADFFRARHALNLLANAIHETFRRHGLQRVERLCFLRENIEYADDLVVFHEADGDVLHHQYTN